jgi:hypothetical protein
MATDTERGCLAAAKTNSELVSKQHAEFVIRGKCFPVLPAAFVHNPNETKSVRRFFHLTPDFCSARGWQTQHF